MENRSKSDRELCANNNNDNEAVASTSSNVDCEQDVVDSPLNDVIPSFSFSGCGFLGVYHVGVAACLREHTDVTNRPEIKFAGASAGALVATTLLCGMNFGEMARILLDTANTVREKEAADLGGQLRDVLDHYLPEDAHEKLSNRLYISMTIMDGLESGLVTDFQSKEHLIQCLIATCFVPGFIGWLPPSIPVDSFHKLGKGYPNAAAIDEEKRREKERQRRRRPIEETDTENEEEEYSNTTYSYTESLWDVISDDERSVDGSMCDEPKRSYIQMLVRLCLKSINTTTKVVRHLPIASSIIPESLYHFDELVEAVIMEITNAKQYMAFDGGFSDNIPSFDSNTITVSPFAGEIDICPRDLTCIDISFDLGNTSMHASEDNIFRLSHALNPMEPEMLLKLCEEGYNDCLKFLSRKDLLCCKKHLMTRATLFSSPCNIGHAYCKCDLCKASDARIRTSLSCVNCQRAKKKALVSNLPLDVQKEFQKSIKAHKNISKDPDVYWNRILSALWWCVEKLYSGTISLAELAIRFQKWTFKFYDNVGLFFRYSFLPLGRKRKLVRYLIASLHKNILSSVSSSSANLCTKEAVQGLQVN